MKKGDKRQFNILKEGVAVWNEWRGKHPEIAINLRYADLSGLHLKRADLSRAGLFRTRYNNATLHKANFQGADLRKTSFRGSFLQYANFEQADMKGADLQGANLSGANFSGSNLQNANLKDAVLNMTSLEDANLKEAVFNDSWMRGTILRQANLSGAFLHRVKMYRADLKRANFKNAHCFRSLFCDLDLSEARGLQAVHHTGPSSVAIDTIYNSGGKIPEIFLRGAGVPERMVSLLSSTVVKDPNYHSCFIVHGHADKVFAKRLYLELQRRDIRCWLYEYNVLSSNVPEDNADWCIRAWDKVLLCCSRSSLTSWWVQNEIDKALKKEQELINKKGEKISTLIPLNLDSYLFHADLGKALAEPILSRLAANFNGWETDLRILEGQIENVVKALKVK